MQMMQEGNKAKLLQVYFTMNTENLVINMFSILFN